MGEYPPPGNEAMKIKYHNTYGDYFAFLVRYVIRRPDVHVINAVCLALVIWSTMKCMPDEFPAVVKWAVCIVVAAGLALVFLTVFAITMVIGVFSRMNSTFLTEHTLAIAPEGLVEETEFNRSEYKWSAVQKVVGSRKHLFIYVSAGSAHIVPRRAFDSDAEWEQFHEKLRQLWVSSTRQNSTVRDVDGPGKQ